MQVTTQNCDENGQACKADDHATAIYAEAAYVLHEVVPSRPKHKPFIPEKRHTDRDQVRNKPGEHVIVRTKASGEPVAERKHGVPKDSVETANEQVTQESHRRLG